MYQLSPNIELLFTEAGAHPDRVRAAAAAGFDAVEMWGTSSVDVDALAAALEETGVVPHVGTCRAADQLRTSVGDPRRVLRGLRPRDQARAATRLPAHRPGFGHQASRPEAGPEPRAPRRGLQPGRRAHPGLRRQARPRGGQHPGRPPRRPHRPHRGRGHGRPGRGLGLVRDPLRPVPLDRRGRGPRHRAQERFRPGRLRADRGRTRAVASRALAASTGQRSSRGCELRGTPGPSGWSTSRPWRPRSPSGTSGRLPRAPEPARTT